MTDPSTGWFKIVQCNNKQAATIEKQVEKTQLCRYLLPTIITYNRENEFLGQAFINNSIKHLYGIKDKCTTTENPQANSIIKIIHQVIEKLVRTFDLKNNYLDKDNPQSGILSDTYFAVQRTYHTMLQSTPGQLVFGRDRILNNPLIEDWEDIRLHKQKIINKNNQLKNKNRKPQTYRIRDKVLVRNKKANLYGDLYVGPYPITQVWIN